MKNKERRLFLKHLGLLLSALSLFPLMQFFGKKDAPPKRAAKKGRYYKKLAG